MSARNPGGRPKTAPVYRVLVHRQYLHYWNSLPERVGLKNAQQFYAHVANTPGGPPSVGTSSILKGKAGEPHKKGYSKTVHYEISGAGRVNYQWSNTATDGKHGDPHPVIKILTIDLDSH